MASRGWNGPAQLVSAGQREHKREGRQTGLNLVERRQQEITWENGGQRPGQAAPHYEVEKIAPWLLSQTPHSSDKKVRSCGKIHGRDG